MTTQLPQIDPLSLFEEVPCYISVQNRELKIIHANRCFREDFGNYEGKYCWEAYKSRTSPCPVCQVKLTFEDGLIHSNEEQVISRSGKPIHMMVYTSPLKDNEGNIIAVMEMSTNITEVRTLQAKLASLGQLVAGTAHSIKSIITGLEGGVYVVNSGFRGGLEDRIKKGWEIVQRNIERISDLALDMLYYSKDRKLVKVPLSISDMLRDIHDLFKPRASKKIIELKANLAHSLPDFSGDKKAIFSLLSNMMENALDACIMDNERGKKHFIELLSRRENDSLVVEIADNGMGMDEDTRSQIFDLFYSTKEAKGTGLGLMVAHKAVTEHGGSIDVDSVPGEGTRFIIKLPLSAGS